jgi:hypothetical protein
MGDILSDCPDYAEALKRERIIRDASFLNVTESVGGFEILPMNFRHYLILRLANNPLLFDRLPSPVDLAAFLWVLSPAYHPQGLGRRKFLQSCRSFLPPLPPLFPTRRSRARHARQSELAVKTAAHLWDCIREYKREIFDEMPGGKISGFDAPYWSDACSICAKFAREFGWNRAETLSLPLKQLFQFLKEMKAINGGPRVILHNPSDAVKARWMEELNKAPTN